MSSEDTRHIHRGWYHWRLLNMGSEAISGLGTPSVSEEKSHVTCALLLMCFLRHQLLSRKATVEANEGAFYPAWCLWYRSLISTQQNGHTAPPPAHQQPDEERAVFTPWAEGRCGSNLGWSCVKQHLEGLQYLLSKSSKAAQEPAHNTFICIISLLRTDVMCNRKKHCKTQRSRRKSN